MKKYLIVPGKVTSKTEGDVHHLTSGDLMLLYRVRPYECAVYRAGDDETPEQIAARNNLRILRPRYDEDYRL